MKRFKYYLWILTIAVAVLIGFTKCQDPTWEERTNYELLIGEYFEQDLETFSMFLDALKKSKTISFLKAYGHYTCFAPTNEAFQVYLTKKGKASLNDFTEDELKQLVRFCVLSDTVPSESFVDGRLEYPTLYGQYLTTGTYYEDGEAVTKVNKTAPIHKKDIRVTNGIIHVVGEVLEPDTRSLVEFFEQLDDYNIFNRAIRETGFDTILNKVPDALTKDTVWYTVFAVSDAVYAESGIKDFDALKEKYGSPVDTSGRDSLYYYMAYHILSDQAKYVSDLIYDKVVKTTAPSEVLTIKASGTKVLVNDDLFAGIYEPGFEINREISDVTVGNGVVHFMKSNFAIKKRYPFAVYWEVTDQLEIRKMPGVYLKNYQTLTYGQLANVTWDPSTTSIGYAPGGGNAYGYTVLNDIFEIYLRPEVVKSITFTTPTLVKGSYKVWVASRNVPTSARMPKFYVYFNGEQTTRIVDCAKAPGMSGGVAPTDAELNISGFKVYSYRPQDFYSADSATVQNNIVNGQKINWMGGNGWGRMSCQLAGVVNVTETGSQTLQFVAISGGASSYLWLDQIHFIPVEEDQNWPRINVDDGSLVYKEDLLAGKFPKPL
ncbi:MAG: fasciclin domain-containing protein [Breznakibacter sp.]